MKIDELATEDFWNQQHTSTKNSTIMTKAYIFRSTETNELYKKYRNTSPILFMLLVFVFSLRVQILFVYF